MIKIYKTSFFLITGFLFLVSCQPKVKRFEQEVEGSRTAIFFKKDGVLDGSYKEFDVNKVLRLEITFDEGVKHGEKRFYDTLGNIEVLQIFQKGSCVMQYQYFPDGNLKVMASKKGDLLDGEYYQFSSKMDTIVTASYRNDTTIYIKAFDIDDPKLILDYHVNPKIEYEAFSIDSLKIFLHFPSPDPNLRWAFALGDFEGDDVEQNKTVLNYVSRDEAFFVRSKSDFSSGILKGVLIEYDNIRNATFQSLLNDTIPNSVF